MSISIVTKFSVLSYLGVQRPRRGQDKAGMVDFCLYAECYLHFGLLLFDSEFFIERVLPISTSGPRRR